MSEDKVFVPILCMHRSGSSLLCSVLAELGMALGPFELMGAAEHNPHGHFESLPFYNLDQQLQRLVLGFSEDMPDSPEILQQLVVGEGRWPDAVNLLPPWLDQGEELVCRLVASGKVSGFKDPRVPLLWPFWMEVFRRMPELRVVPVVLLRSPHEIAMSIFMRSKGRFDYCDALDVAAVHFKRIGAILADWRGPLGRVRFLPEYFVEDLRGTCRLLGLTWSEEIYARVFDVQCRHHLPAAVAHPAQSLFEELAALPVQEFTCPNAARIEADALLRQRLLRRNQMDAEAALASSRMALSGSQAELAATQRELSGTRAALSSAQGELSGARAELSGMRVELANTQTELSGMRTELSVTQAELSGVRAKLSIAHADLSRMRARLCGAQAQLSGARAELGTKEARARRLAAELDLTKASRCWRLRELLVTLPVLRRFANQPLVREAATGIRHAER